MKSMEEEKWKNKALHGLQYPRIPEKPHVDTVTTHKWLASNLKRKTEGLLIAVQDQLCQPFSEELFDRVLSMIKD